MWDDWWPSVTRSHLTKDGVDYHFVRKDDMEQMIKEGALAMEKQIALLTGGIFGISTELLRSMWVCLQVECKWKTLQISCEANSWNMQMFMGTSTAHPLLLSRH